MEETYLPQTGDAPELVKILERAQTSATYKLDVDRACIRGMADKRDAVAQAVYLVLSVERYRYVIYSRNYGVELEDLIGKPKDYIMTEAKRRITEALLQDDRITAVERWQFEAMRNAVKASFVVRTVFGDIGVEKEVSA